MKAYSQYNLIAEELEKMEYEPEGFVDRITHFFLNILDKAIDYYSFDIRVPNYYYYRAKILCEDIEDLSENEFKSKDLLYLLFRRFLRSVKEIDDPYEVYRLLFVRSLEQPKIKRKGTSIIINDVNTKKEGNQQLKLFIRRKDILRCEVFLKTLDNVVPGHDITVEKVLEIIFIDFIYNYEKGNSENVINELIKALEDED